MQQQPPTNFVSSSLRLRPMQLRTAKIEEKKPLKKRKNVFKTIAAGNPKPRIPECKRLKVVQLWQNGSRRKDIADVVGISPYSVDNIVSRYKDHNTVQFKPRKPRPCKISAQDMQAAEKYHKNHEEEMLTVRQWQEYMWTHRSKAVSRPTMRRMLENSNFWGYVPQRKPAMSAKTMAKRVAMGRRWMAMSDEELYDILFSDEHTLMEDVKTKPEKTYYKKGTPFYERKTLPKHAFGGTHLSIFAVISPEGIVAHAFYSGRMTGDCYADILQQHLIPYIHKKYRRRRPLLFQQDNATCHRTKEVQAVLQDNRIPILDWPPNSPDLNLIENLWAEVGKRLRDYPRSKVHEMRAATEEIIAALNAEEEHTGYFKSLYASLRERAQQVVNGHGRPINY